MNCTVEFKLVDLDSQADITKDLKAEQWGLNWKRELSFPSSATLTVAGEQGCCPLILRGLCSRLEIYLDGKRCDSYIYKAFEQQTNGDTIYRFVSPSQIIFNRLFFKLFVLNLSGAATFYEVAAVLDRLSPLGVDVQYTGGAEWQTESNVAAGLPGTILLADLLSKGLEYTEKSTIDRPHIIYYGDLSNSTYDYEVSESDFVTPPLFGADADLSASYVTVTNQDDSEQVITGSYPDPSVLFKEENNSCGFNPRRVIVEDLESVRQAERIAQNVYENARSEFYLGSVEDGSSNGVFSDSFGLDLCDLLPGSLLKVGDLACEEVSDILRLGGLDFNARNGQLDSVKSEFDFVI